MLLIGAVSLYENCKSDDVVVRCARNSKKIELLSCEGLAKFELRNAPTLTKDYSPRMHSSVVNDRM